jgi:hypothetical protein
MAMIPSAASGRLKKTFAAWKAPMLEPVTHTLPLPVSVRANGTTSSTMYRSYASCRRARSQTGSPALVQPCQSTPSTAITVSRPASMRSATASTIPNPAQSAARPSCDGKAIRA